MSINAKTHLAVTDADQLDGTVFGVADSLENLVMLAEDLADYYPEIPELREILRSVKAALAELEKAQSPVRRLWNIANDKANWEGGK